MFLVKQIAHKQTANIQHDPVEVPAQHNPFTTANQRDAFWVSFLNVTNMGIIPNGYDLYLEDDKDMFYECIWMGHKCTELSTGLPVEILQPHVIHWCQAPDILLHVHQIVK